MRKSLVAIFVLALIVSLFFLLKRSDTAKPSNEAALSEEQATSGPATTDPLATRPRWTKPTRNEASANETTESSKAIVYGPSEFARGELQNIVVDDGGIRLGNNASFVPRFNPKFRIFGNFISPETDATEPFDALSLNMQASALGENEVIFEVRTRSRFGEWTEWREVTPQNMKDPMPAEAPKSTGYQFRVALFANDAAGSPKVETISIEPISTAQNLSANNNNNTK